MENPEDMKSKVIENLLRALETSIVLNLFDQFLIEKHGDKKEALKTKSEYFRKWSGVVQNEIQKEIKNINKPLDSTNFLLDQLNRIDPEDLQAIYNDCLKTVKTVYNSSNRAFDGE